MSSILTVLRFEYMGYIKSKQFRVVTIVVAAILILLSFLPRIIGGFSTLFDGMMGKTQAVVVLSDEVINQKEYTTKSLKAIDETIKWTNGNKKDIEPKELKELVKSEEYDLAIYLDADGSYKLYANSSDMILMGKLDAINDYITKVLRDEAISKLPADTGQVVNETLMVAAKPEIFPVSVGKDGADTGASYVLNYVVVVVLFIVISIYGSMITTAVVSEKSSRAMELLVTSINPTKLMLGKVFGTGLAALTQFAIFIIFIIGGILVNMINWKTSSPEIYNLISSMAPSTEMIILTIIFLLLGYFIYAFIFAALGSTISKMEEAGGVTTIPTLLMTAGYILSLIGSMDTGSKLFTVCSYIPFFTPFTMLSRYNMGSVTIVNVIISIAIMLITIGFIAFLAGKIYRVGVMMYGNPMKLGLILKAIKG
jgi:ABC-2 type transport system permease protein